MGGSFVYGFGFSYYIVGHWLLNTCGLFNKLLAIEYETGGSMSFRVVNI